MVFFFISIQFVFDFKTSNLMIRYFTFIQLLLDFNTSNLMILFFTCFQFLLDFKTSNLMILFSPSSHFFSTSGRLNFIDVFPRFSFPPFLLFCLDFKASPSLPRALRLTCRARRIHLRGIHCWEPENSWPQDIQDR